MALSHQIDRDIPLNLAILTVSDTRTVETDKGGNLIQEKASSSGMAVVKRMIVKDDSRSIRECIQQWLKIDEIDAIIVTGGTGIAKRDVSIEAIWPFFEKEIDGFGELFRYLSFTEDIGTKALLSRAAAGIANEKPIFIIPGSTGAVKLAMDRLIVPELPHIKHELTKHRNATN